MILHMLGGGPAQISAIKRSREKGLKVLVSDFNRSAPGFSQADYQSFASTFDEEAVYCDAKETGSDCIMTTGTDQPVLTAARVSRKLGLPYFLTAEQALVVTNKKVMKRAFRESRIPTMNFVIIKEDFLDTELSSLSFPLVIKPLDSQGQRGVLKVENIHEIRDNFAMVLSFSKESEILAEEYYVSNELTISGWVENGAAKILMITDRVTVDNGPHLGVCVSHRYPSLCHDREDELKGLVQKITKMIGLDKGPLYFQILSGEKGFRVNEIACRLGGAYEDEFIPYMTGIPLLDIMIDMTSGAEYTLIRQRDIDKSLDGKFLSLQMFFSRPGVLYRQSGMDKVCSIDGILNGRFLLEEGTLIESRENSTQRAGYFIVTGSSPEQINKRIEKAYNFLKMEDSAGVSLLQFYDRMLFPL
jgi:biotin carboxylase